MSTYGFTITTEPPTGAPKVYVFEQIAAGTGKLFALNCSIGAPIRDLLRYSPRGVQGNITIRDDISGRPIILRGMIADTLALARAKFREIVQELRANSCKIKDVINDEYTTCNLIDGRMLDELPNGTTTGVNDVELNIELTFTQDRGF